MARARTVADVILAEATSGSTAERWNDMLGIASVIANRANATNEDFQSIISAKGQFDGYGMPIPEGAEAYRSLAEQAINHVQQNGPVHGATYFATQPAVPGLKNSAPNAALNEVGRTKGHTYFEDRNFAPIVTAAGAIAPNRESLIAARMPQQMSVVPQANPARTATSLYANPMSIYGARTTSEMGRRADPITGKSRMHAGLDMTAQHGRQQTGVPVQSIADGRVEFAGNTRGYGNMVEIAHNDGFTSRYAHLEAIPSSIAQGMQINAGTPIGTLGNTGRSTAPHLHLEVRDETGRPVNPRDYVNLEAKAPPIPETSPNRSAPQMMAENPPDGIANTQGSNGTGIAMPGTSAPSGLLGFAQNAPTQTAPQSAPQTSPTANPHQGVSSYEGRAPSVTVANTPAEIAAAEVAMNDPAFSGMSATPASLAASTALSSSQVADSRIADAFSQPAQTAFNVNDANSAWGALSSVTPGLSESLAQAVNHQGPASFDMAGNVYGNHAPAQSMTAQSAPMPSFNEMMAINHTDDVGLAPLDSVPYSPSQGPMAPAQVASAPMAAPHGPASTPTYNAPQQTTPAFNAFDQSRPANNAPISRGGQVAPQASQVAAPVTPGSMATGGPVVALDAIAEGIFGGFNADSFGSLGGLGGMVGKAFSPENIGTMVGGAFFGIPGAMAGRALGSRLSAPPQDFTIGTPNAVALAHQMAMAGYTPGLAFPGAPSMMAGMLGPSGSNMSYSDMAAISPAAADALASGNSSLF